MSNDPTTYAVERIQIIDKKIAELPEIFNEPGSTFSELKGTFDSLIRDKGRFLEIYLCLLLGCQKFLLVQRKSIQVH